MATLVTVHGTFAHLAGKLAATSTQGDEAQVWWQSNAEFASTLRELVEGEDGPLKIEPFIWSGDNAENERREAGERLFGRLQELERSNEKYCLLGHSHGGSVISHALLQSIINNEPLNGLKRWITVGTPFVELRKERYLFLRLPLIMKAIFVASLMLLFMYVFSTVGEFIYGNIKFANQYQIWRIVLSGLLAAIPFFVFYIVANYLDHKRLFRYRPKHVAAARKEFGPKWVPLVHEDDEAVSGLSSLGTVRVGIFSPEFAVPFLTLLSVFILPLAYLYVVTSPGIMMNVTDMLKSHVYDVQSFDKQRSDFAAKQSQLNKIRRELRKVRREQEQRGIELQPNFDGRAKVRSLRKQLTQERKKLRAEFPQATELSRAARFSSRFLEQQGTRYCRKGKLRGCGLNVPLNANLLFHLVTDEATSWMLSEDVRFYAVRRFIGYALAVLIVPFIFGLVAVAIVLVMQILARLISSVASKWFDRLTWFEVNRAALGNDTEEEVAVSVARRPSWLKKQVRCIPGSIGDKITEHSNREMTASLGKFRNAISELAFADAKENKSDAILNYLSWKELIHTSYFSVPEFKRLIARALSQADGFKPTQRFRDDSHYVESEMWLAAVGINPTHDKP